MANRLNEFVSKKIGAGRKSAINVVMLYASAECGKRAIQAYDRLVQRFGKQADFESDFWNFNALRHDAIQAQARHEMARADLVLVAPDASDDVPEHIRQWVKTCADGSPRSRHPMVATLKRKLPKPANIRATRAPSMIDLFLECPAAPRLAVVA